MLRFAVADSEGRMGSVDRKVAVWQMNASGLTVGDLMVAESVRDPAATAVGGIEPQVATGRLAAMMEVYAPDMPALEGVEGRLEIVAADGAAPLATEAMRVARGDTPEVAVLEAALNTAPLPPGRYLARATVVHGGKAQGHIVRPFRVVAAAREADAMPVLPMPLPAELRAAMLANLPIVDRQTLLTPAVLTAVMQAAARTRPPAAADALATARTGKLGAAALDALAAGDQPLAAFLRGLEFFSQGQLDRAIQQLQVAMQQAPAFAPARLYLGAALAAGSKYREAAGLLQSVTADAAIPAPIAQMAGLSWLHAGDAALAIETLQQAGDDGATTRMLALAYVVGSRPADAMPLLAAHLAANPNDQAALLAAIYAAYAAHVPAPRPESLETDRARAAAWAKSYTSLKGTHQGLVDAWIGYLQSAK